MRILLWHVHGSWTDAFVQGDHDYLFPWQQGDETWALGSGGRNWPPSAVEVPVGELADAGIDLVVLQRPEELVLCERWLGRAPGPGVPAVYLEHNAPRGEVPHARHPLADRGDIPIVHVTHFNELFWDNGDAPTAVIEHGIIDPGYRYKGELPRLGVVINEPLRRWRVTGSDLLPAFTGAGPIDLFGIDGQLLVDRLDLDPRALRFAGNLAPDELHAELALRRAYLHPARWTSLGLSLIEAMQLGMPVVALATTEVIRAVPPEAGAVSTSVTDLVAGAAELLADPELARVRGLAAREFALEHYGLPAFLTSWDAVLSRVAT